MKTKSLILLFILTISVFISFSQTSKDTAIVRIETKDGNEFLGQIVSEDSVKTVLKTEKFGEISILNSEITKRESVKVQQIKDGKLWFDNPQSTRYFWAPNGYGLKKGEAYYQNIWVLWNQFSVGITDYFSLGAGIVPTFLFGAPTPVFITPKVSIPVVKDKFNIGAGVIAGYVLGETDAGFGIFYGTATYGSRDNNFSVGVGEMFASGEWAPAPLFNFSGMARVSNRGYFLTENYFIKTNDVTVVMLSFGGRTIIKKVSLDYGLVIPLSNEMDTFIALPWLGIAIPIGKKK